MLLIVLCRDSKKPLDQTQSSQTEPPHWAPFLFHLRKSICASLAKNKYFRQKYKTIALSLKM